MNSLSLRLTAWGCVCAFRRTRNRWALQRDTGRKRWDRRSWCSNTCRSAEGETHTHSLTTRSHSSHWLDVVIHAGQLLEKHTHTQRVQSRFINVYSFMRFHEVLQKMKEHWMAMVCKSLWAIVCLFTCDSCSTSVWLGRRLQPRIRFMTLLELKLWIREQVKPCSTWKDMLHTHTHTSTWSKLQHHLIWLIQLFTHLSGLLNCTATVSKINTAWEEEKFNHVIIIISIII